MIPLRLVLTMNTDEIKARIEKSWQTWKTLPEKDFYKRRMDFFLTLDISEYSWYDFKHILETVIAEKLEKEGK